MSDGPRDRANWWGLKCRWGMCAFAPNLLFGPIGGHCAREGCSRQVIVDDWPPKGGNWPYPDAPAPVTPKPSPERVE
jgi:hypothetical protein